MRLKRFINIHTILIAVIIITVLGIVYRFFNWGQLVNLDEIFKEIGDVEIKTDVFDFYLPAMDNDGNIVPTDGEISTVVCFGNAPFADDRDSKDNLAQIVARKTGLTVYNCSIGGSYLAARNYGIVFEDYPQDAYNLYWLAHLACKSPVYEHCATAAEALGDDAAPEAQEVYDTIWNLDFNTVDAIVIMYDASDYLAGSEMYNDNESTDIRCFTGNLEASIELIKTNYPQIRIIVMSPTYAYAVDEDGKYISSDMYTYGQDVLSTYVIKEFQSCHSRNVTFIDHLYGTIDADNAKKYLTDNLHLNKAGRNLVADRLIKALYYYENSPD